MINPEVLFEDEVFLVINKPSGWVVNYVSSAKKSPILETWLTKNYKYEIAGNKEFRSGIVHRLDKETSGVLVVAKTEVAFKYLQKQFKSRQVKKQYLALVHVKVEPGDGVISTPIGRLPWRRDRFGVIAGGRNAETGYSAKDYYKQVSNSQEFTLLKVSPRTGRTHQIRVHMKRLGHSVVGDEFYAGRKVSRSDREWCPRLFLHAWKLSIKHPENEKLMSFKSELPSDLQGAITHLEKPREN